MTSRPLVSVIVPFFNAEKFLEEAVESVLLQTYDRWEVVLVDDGSTDVSPAIARRYAVAHAGKIRYLMHPGRQNRGACASRNLAIRDASGDYIALLDADDVWLPQKLERQVATLASHPEAAMVYGSTQYWRSWDGTVQDGSRDYVPDLRVETNTLMRPPALLKRAAPLGEAITPCPSDLIFRREMVERVGGFEESFRGIYQLCEDQAFLVKVYLHEAVFVAGECWDKYREHPDSCVSTVKKAGQYHAARLFFLNWLQEYLSQQGVQDPEIWEALRRVLWPYRHPILHRLRGRAQYYTKPLRSFLKMD
jgi:glycosyltransferase involved in cell wall biosynthesis